MASSLNLLHIVSSLHPNAGGTARTVVELTDSIACDNDVRVTLLTQRLENEPTVQSLSKRVNRQVCTTSSRQSLRLGMPVRNELSRIMRYETPSLVHSHSLWMPINHWATMAARQFHLPLVVQPHGTLSPWALSHKALKKKLAMAFYQRRDLESAALLVATSAEEYKNIRNLGLSQPIAIIPNGVQLDDIASMSPKSTDHNRIRTALFLSRIHPIKGLLHLIEAWARLRPQNWQLRIVGPDEGGYLATVMKAIREQGIIDSVEYMPEVNGKRKAQIYQAADLFILPTFSENFGVVVAEALTHKLPVITTRGAPWADLETHDCGWWIDIGVVPLLDALREATSLSDEQRQAMGERGKVYVQRYDWNDIAQKTLATYRWVLNVGQKPDCVRTD